MKIKDEDNKRKQKELTRGTFCVLGISFEASRERGLVWGGNGGGQKRWRFTMAHLDGDMVAWVQV